MEIAFILPMWQKIDDFYHDGVRAFSPETFENYGFSSQEDRLLEIADKIRNIPIYPIDGRYDMICRFDGLPKVIVGLF